MTHTPDVLETETNQTTETPIEATPETTSVDEKKTTAVETQEIPHIATMLAEAEQRGYMRGRNEAIENLMGNPVDTAETLMEFTADDTAETLILSNTRPSIWD